MAVTKTLKSRIDELISSLQEVDRTQIKAALVKFARIAEALEDGTATRKTDAKIARLKSALETSKSNYAAAYVALENSCSEIKDLQSELQTMQAEIAKYQEERAKEEESKREIPPIQFEILRRLGSPATCDWLDLGQIARALKIPVDEAELYVDGLGKLGLVFFHPHEPGGGGWLRTTEGNKIAVAKRWAGEEGDRTQHKYPDLPGAQHKVLVALGSDLDGLTEETIAEKAGLELPRTIRALRLLRKAGMATDGGSEAVVFADGALWCILERGEEYLEERDLL
jgi:hypothetical protein